MADNHHFSGPVTVFLEQALPERATPAGYAALIRAYNLQVPLPRTFSAIGEHDHRTKTESGWRIFTSRQAPASTLEGHLTFALKNEGLDLAVLKRLFAAAPAEIEGMIRAQSTGSYARRIWFLFEWLTGIRLDIPNAATGNYVLAVNPDQQWTVPGQNSPRHRVRNNLPGTPAFCPLVFRTEALEEFAAMDLVKGAREAVARVPKDLLSRTAAFLLLQDSRSSYAIEGESPPQNRIQRWGRAIGEAGRRPIDLDELLRLQAIVIGDSRFVRLGLREEGGFIGEHDRDTRMPIPDHISARPEDLHALIHGMVAFDRGPAQDMDAVIAAAVLAFGFVYVHPFADGNGRLHRYLIHHVLANRGFNPAGVVFPVSAAILENIHQYRARLEDYSRRLLPLIEWQPTEDGNVKVRNDTADFYRFFDATPLAEFLYACVKKTIDVDLPREAEFLARYDQFRLRIANIVDMPDRMVNLLFGFLHQNQGQLSKRAREHEFMQLTDSEAAATETAYATLFP